jgi:hypothetical protein
MPLFTVTVTETVTSTFVTEVEAQCEEEACNIFEDQIVNYPEDNEAVREDCTNRQTFAIANETV